MRRIFGKWPSHIGRDARRQARDPLRSPSWRALPLPPLLESVAENVALAPVSACSRIWSVSVPSSLRRQAHWPRPSRAFLLVKTRRLPCACSVCRGKPSVSWSGPAVSTLIQKVSGLGRYRPSRFVGEAAITNAGPLAGTRRCISQHVFAVVMARSGRLLSTLRPMAPSIPTREGSRERPWSRGSPEVMGREGG